MNTISHALIGYTASMAIFGPEITAEYTAPILISSTIMDIDHISYIFHHVKTSMHSIKKGTANSHISGIFHKIYSQFAFLFLALIASFFINHTIIQIITLNVFLHMAVDALVSNNNRVFAPVSEHSLSIRIFGHKWKRTVADLATIPLLAFVLWII